MMRNTPHKGGRPARMQRRTPTVDNHNTRQGRDSWIATNNYSEKKTTPSVDRQTSINVAPPRSPCSGAPLAASALAACRMGNWGAIAHRHQPRDENWVGPVRGRSKIAAPRSLQNQGCRDQKAPDREDQLANAGLFEIVAIGRAEIAFKIAVQALIDAIPMADNGVFLAFRTFQRRGQI